MIAPIIRHVTSRPNVCERTIKTILLACLQAQQLQRNHRRARPRLNCKPLLRGAFWLHSTAVFAGAGLSTRSTDFAVRCNYIWNGWRYRPLRVQRDGGGGGDRHFSNYYYVPAFGPGILVTRALVALETRATYYPPFTYSCTDRRWRIYIHVYFVPYARKDPLSQSEQTKFPQIKFIPV